MSPLRVVDLEVVEARVSPLRVVDVEGIEARVSPLRVDYLSPLEFELRAKVAAFAA